MHSPIRLHGVVFNWLHAMAVLFPDVFTSNSHSQRMHVIHSARLCLKPFGESVISSINTVCRYKYVIDFMKSGVKLSIL
jgi:hypothetical protein